MNEEVAYLGFALTKGIGPLRFKLLKDHFGCAEKAWSAPAATLIEIGLGNKLTGYFVSFRETFKPDIFSQELARKEIKFIPQIDKNFPAELKQVADPPIGLFVKGDLKLDYSYSIAIVGTRKPTNYGQEVTRQLVSDLVDRGFTIISGLARGVDGIAHRVTLENHGKTIAVLGCGVDIVYPPEHTVLYADIIKSGGAIISEVPPGHTVSKGLFPARNRIISGLSRGVVVTEGADDSGSLITAKLALEQNRDVFAVPGPITSYLSAGPTSLIKQGAKVVTDVKDILEEFDMNGMTTAVQIKNKKNGRNVQEQQIIDLLARGSVHFDDLVHETRLPTADLGSILTMLELSGIIRNLGNGEYSLV